MSELAHVSERRSSRGRVAAVETVVRAGFMPPLHAHDTHEALTVLDGSVTVFAGDEVVRLRAADTHVVPGGVAHTLRAESARALVTFATSTPSAGLYESFLRAAGPVSLGESGAPSWTSEDDAGAVSAIAEAAGITVLGPPGALPAEAETAARAA